MTEHNTAEAQLDMTQYDDHMERVLQRALRDVRSVIAAQLEHIAKYPTVGRELAERRCNRAKAEEQVIFQALTLRQTVLLIDAQKNGRSV